VIESANSMHQLRFNRLTAAGLPNVGDDPLYPYRDGRGFERAFAYLLAPERIVEPGFRQQIRVDALFYDFSSFENVDSLRVHHRRQTVGNQNRDDIGPLSHFADGSGDLLFGDGIE
jgi:hypothetical protein